MKRNKIKKILKRGLIIILAIGVIIMFLDRSFSAAKYKDGDPRFGSLLQSPQFISGKFQNSKKWEQPSIGESLSTMRDFIIKKKERTPAVQLPCRNADLNYFNDQGRNQLSATWLGHSSIMLNMDGYQILIDPVFEKRVSIIGPSRFNGELPLDPEQIKEVDIVIISHNHYDHLNKFSIQLLREKTGLFIVPLGVGAELEGWGVSREKVIEMDWWDEYHVNKDILIAAAPAQHFSGRGLTDRNKTLWASWIVRTKNHKIFFSGDSGYFHGFKQIGEKYGPFDMTFLECGAYNEKWHHIHMYPEETVRAHLDLKGDILHPIHWATYNLSLHSWHEPMDRFSRAAEISGIKFSTPIPGETTIYGNYIPTKKWWEKYKKKQK